MKKLLILFFITTSFMTFADDSYTLQDKYFGFDFEESDLSIIKTMKENGNHIIYKENGFIHPRKVLLKNSLSNEIDADYTFLLFKNKLLTHAITFIKVDNSEKDNFYNSIKKDFIDYKKDESNDIIKYWNDPSLTFKISHKPFYDDETIFFIELYSEKSHLKEKIIHFLSDEAYNTNKSEIHFNGMVNLMQIGMISSSKETLIISGLASTYSTFSYTYFLTKKLGIGVSDNVGFEMNYIAPSIQILNMPMNKSLYTHINFNARLNFLLKYGDSSSRLFIEAGPAISLPLLNGYNNSNAPIGSSTENINKSPFIGGALTIAQQDKRRRASSITGGTLEILTGSFQYSDYDRANETYYRKYKTALPALRITAAYTFSFGGGFTIYKK